MGETHLVADCPGGYLRKQDSKSAEGNLMRVRHSPPAPN